MGWGVLFKRCSSLEHSSYTHTRVLYTFWRLISCACVCTSIARVQANSDDPYCVSVMVSCVGVHLCMWFCRILSTQFDIFALIATHHSLLPNKTESRLSTTYTYVYILYVIYLHIYLLDHDICIYIYIDV